MFKNSKKYFEEKFSVHKSIKLMHTKESVVYGARHFKNLFCFRMYVDISIYFSFFLWWIEVCVLN